jgi:integrase
MVARNIDPRDEADQRERERRRERESTFARVAEDWLAAQEAKGLRKAGEARRVVGREFTKLWENRPIVAVTLDDVEAAVNTMRKRAPGNARNAYGYLRALFNYAVRTRRLKESPCKSIESTQLVGEKVARSRVLTNAELRSVWLAAGEMGYPYGPIVQLLILTGGRLKEIVDLSWSEIDLEHRLTIDADDADIDFPIITIPASRMKGKRDHIIPVAPRVMEILQSLPRHAGPHLFTTTGGRVPVDSMSRVKRRIDAMCGVKAWCWHDLRRTMRSKLSALPIEDRVRKAMIAHAQPGLHKVYDLHTYAHEKKTGFVMWEKMLTGIVTPRPPAEVISITSRKTA